MPIQYRLKMPSGIELGVSQLLKGSYFFAWCRNESEIDELKRLTLRDTVSLDGYEMFLREAVKHIGRQIIPRSRNRKLSSMLPNSICY